MTNLGARCKENDRTAQGTTVGLEKRTILVHLTPQRGALPVCITPHQTQKKTTVKTVVFYLTQVLSLHLAAQHTQQTLRRLASVAHALRIKHSNLRLITLLN